MDFEAVIVSADEWKEWLPTYPGDPLERKAGIYVTFRTQKAIELHDWMIDNLGDRAERFSPDDDFNFTRAFMPWDFRVIYRVESKLDVMRIRLAFPTMNEQ